jgi:cyclic pyranopterin phosphate synthase
MKPVVNLPGNGPAQYYSLSNAKGTIGFISGSSSSFCNNCSRIRIDCAGRISPCLFSGQIYDMRTLLRSGVDDSLILKKIKDILQIKPRYTKETINQRKIEMSSLGG